MSNKFTKITLMVVLVLALAFTFSCSSDGFKTVKIGNQVWMAENLNIDVSGSKCYDNKPANCDEYGRLYDWATAMKLDISCNSSSCASQIKAKHQGICPSGWHIPSNDDWNILMKTVNPSCSGNGSCAGAGTKLKARDGWNSDGGVPGTDEFGFSALPGGYGNSDGYFNYVGDDGYWWSATEDNADYAYSRLMYYDYENVLRKYGNKDYYLFSVRCVQD